MIPKYEMLQVILLCSMVHICQSWGAGYLEAFEETNSTEEGLFEYDMLSNASDDSMLILWEALDPQYPEVSLDYHYMGG